MNLNEYVILDFETANQDRSSACQIGVIKVRDGEIIDRFSSLIKPEPFIFGFQQVSIHGIDESKVKNSPKFNEVWEQVKGYFSSGVTVLAHNAGFDISVLRKLNEQYNLKIEDFNYGCTSIIIKKHTNLSKTSLGHLAEINNLQFDTHHDALEDVIMTQKIVNIYFGKNIISKSNQIGYKFKRFSDK